MTHPHKVKGTRAELAVAKYLAAHGFDHAERSRAGWQTDRGDIDGIPGVVIEVKDCKSHDLPGWLRELEQEIGNAEAVTGVVVVKRRGSTDPGDWYAVTVLANWCAMAKDAGL